MTTTQPTDNPDHDRYAAGIYQAIALRFYSRYVDARSHAEFRGEDLPGAEPLVTSWEAGHRYERAVEEWIHEQPDTVDAILALTEFVGVVAADKLVGEALREGGPVSDEKDALHQIIAIEAIGEWLSGPAQREWLDRRQAAYGPSGMAPQETRAAEAAPITAAQLAELRALAEALAAENSAPLPDGDAGLIEAARRHRESRRQCAALYHQLNINVEAENEMIIGIIDPTEKTLLDFVERTEPVGLAGAAAKLRLLADDEIGIQVGEPSEGEIASLKQIAELVERLVS